MSESLIPIVKNFRLRVNNYYNVMIPPGSDCSKPKDDQTEPYISFDLLCWNPTEKNLTVPSSMLQYQDPSDKSSGYIKDFYRYRLIGFTNTSHLDRYVNAQLQDVESGFAEMKSSQFSLNHQGISGGWMSRSNGDQYCELISYVDYRAGVYLLEITADPKRYFPEWPTGNNRTWKWMRLVGGIQIFNIEESVIPWEISIVEHLDLPKISFDAKALRLVENGRIQQIKFGETVLIGFSNALVAARRALEVIQANDFTEAIVLGVADANGRYPFYGFQNKKSPINPRIRRESCSSVNLAHAEYSNGSWKVMEGSKMLFDMGRSEANARLIAAFILYHDFSYFCSAGLPASSMKYLK